MFVGRLLLLFIGTGALPLRNESFITNDEEFIPSYEWKPIKEGQAIPAGLHVRLNLQTGEREAKLLDDPKVHQDLIGRLLDQLKKTNEISVLKELEDLLHQVRSFSLRSSPLDASLFSTITPFDSPI